ncbi:cyclic lactone autoinducer peptide [Anaeromicropila populeti]|uniref:Cyclic lactone autoinducer peptide n=1 Tax=Anaeromicropila populeti TaxID=37658 RepID=A0A1I6IRH9_9FIRM|nr:cyclic lactone autoinducer peptide [Anaeromicropila populeti]SFR69241.1 cyclic lactone autoinducer peptide [Anaeromicropila populeti]
MKETKDTVKAAIVSLSEQVVKNNVNCACWWFLHQPKLPKGAEKFKKH